MDQKTISEIAQFVNEQKIEYKNMEKKGYILSENFNALNEFGKAMYYLFMMVDEFLPNVQHQPRGK